MSQEKSIFTELRIQSTDGERLADLSQGVVAFEYYEDIFSPIITGKLRIINSDNSIQIEGREGKESLYNGLPLRGGERLTLVIASNSISNPGLDFSRVEKYFYVSAVTDVVTEGSQESFTLHLVPREAITNETARVSGKFPSSLSISDSVKNIIKDHLTITESNTKINTGIIDKTSNKYGFMGNMRKPFTVLTWLASKAVPESREVKGGSAGFVFYQTVNGFQFRSLDELAKQKPIAEYIHYDVVDTYDKNLRKSDGSNNIIRFFIEKNSNLIEKLRLGSYSNESMYFNPLTLSFNQKIYKSADYQKKVENLGSRFKLPPINSDTEDTLGNVPTRKMTFVSDIGTYEKGVDREINADPTEFQNQALMRYNTLFTQTISMTVQSNTNLKAGDVIDCKFPRLSESNSNEYDPETSGLYIIKELCHHFNTVNSYTSLKIVRDTFGPQVKK